MFGGGRNDRDRKKWVFSNNSIGGQEIAGGAGLLGWGDSFTTVELN